MMDTKKKPITISTSSQKAYQENTYAQDLLLKAISDGVVDSKELQRRAGLRSAAELYRTLDKLSLRKGYHEALANQGITLDTIANKFGELLESGSEKIQLGTLVLLTKSLGLDKYEAVEDSGKTWEEEIIKATEAAQARGENLKELEAAEFIDYEVITPETPQTELERQEHERKVGREIYGE